MDRWKTYVRQRTGVRWEEIPEGTPEDLLGSHILTSHQEAETTHFVVYVGYPDYQEEDGTEIWGEAALRKIRLSSS